MARIRVRGGKSGRWAAAIGVTGAFAASVAGASTIEVTHLVDDASTANGTCTLREAVRAANANVAVDACPAGQGTARDVIVVRPGTHRVALSSGAGEELAATGDLDLRGSVLIRGASSRYSIIESRDSLPIDRVFHVHDDAEDVAFEGITLRGGNPGQDSGSVGGALWNQETGVNDVELFEVEIADSRAASGGGIFNAGNLKLVRSRIVDNGSGNEGGGISSNGVSAVLRIEDSEISGNAAESNGGGLWVGSGSLVLHRSKLLDNLAGSNGGGMAVATNAYDVQYSEFSRNTAGSGGGAHLADQGEIQRSAFIGNVGTVRGGGVHDVGGAFLRFSTFAWNRAPAGGAVYAQSNQTLLDSDTIVDNTGGGVFNQQGAFFENTLLADNAGGNCTGTAPNFGAFNLEDANACGFGPSPTGPNFPNTEPRLGTLADNGGPTPTIALRPGSPAIDVVTSEIRTNCQNMRDQRGHPRGRPRTQNAQGDVVFLCDIGAFEVTNPFVVDALDDRGDVDADDDRCRTSVGTCTLRAAVQQANAIAGMNEIVLGPGVHTLSIPPVPNSGEFSGLHGDLDLIPPVVIRGSGTGLTTVDGALLDRVFEIGPPPVEITAESMTSTVRDLTITRGDAKTANGGGILARSALRVLRARLTANDATRGSAISSGASGFSFGDERMPVEIVESTVDANPGGGALFLGNAVLDRSALVGNLADGGFNGGGGEFLRVRLENSTVSGNHSIATGAFFANQALIESSTIVDNTADAGFDPGGFFLLELSVIRNSILANNRAGSVLRNCSLNPDALVSFGYNVTDGNAAECLLSDPTDQVSANPLLGALALNGGKTLSRAPLAGSPAIDRGDPTVCPVRDQAGRPRPLDGDVNGSAICDVGAIEVPEPALALLLGAGVAGLTLLGRNGRGGRFGRPALSRRLRGGDRGRADHGPAAGALVR